MCSTGYHPQDMHTTLSTEIVQNVSCGRCPVHHIVYPVESYSPQDIHYTLQDITHRTYHPISCVWYPVDYIIYPVDYNLYPVGSWSPSPQDIKYTLQDITHRIYHPVHWETKGISCTWHHISCGEHYMWCCPQDIQMLYTGYMHSTGYILYITLSMLPYRIKLPPQN